MSNIFSRLLRAATTVALAAVAGTAAAQQPVDYTWQNVAVGDWAGTGASYNWDDPLGLGGSPLPTGSFGERALINNGGTAEVTTTVTQPGEVIVSGESTVRITGTGVLTTDDNNAVSNGNLTVGQGESQGTLVVESGGQLTVNDLNAFAPGSVIDLLGTASVTANFTANVNRELRVTGPDVSFSANALGANDNSIYTPVVTGATHSKLVITNEAELNGALQPDLTGAPPVSIGDSWDLIEAGSVVGAYDSIVATGATLPFGQVFAVNQVPNGATTLVRLEVENRLFIEVNTDDGSIEIKSSDSTPIAIDGYSIGSTNQHLDPSNGAWNSLFDQGAADWVEANPTAGRLNEVQVAGSTDVSDSAALSLGAAYSPSPAEFGESIQDLEFTYVTPTGEQVDGLVTYTGAGNVNNFALIVDPATGEAQIKNSSGFTVEIDGYQITTTDGAFDVTGWDSLSDQSVDGWVEANPTTTALSEVDIDDATSFSGGGAFNIGDLFAGAVTQDLEFSFLVAGEQTPRDGVVLYGALPDLPSAIPGDFDGDGDVDVDDFGVFVNSFQLSPQGGPPFAPGDFDEDGDVDVDDFGVFVNSFQLFPPQPGVAVPEPAALAYASVLAILGAARRPEQRRAA